MNSKKLTNRNAWDVSDVEPTTIDKLINVHTPLIQSIISSYWEMNSQKKNHPLSFLFYGPNMSGRGLLSRIIYREFALLNWSVVYSSNVNRDVDLIEPLHAINGDGMLILRSDQLAPTLRCQRLLEEILISRKMLTESTILETVDTSNLVIVMIANNLPSLSQSLLSQFRYILKFEPNDYQKEDRLLKIIDQRLCLLDLKIEDKGKELLAYYANGIPGIAIRIIEMAHLIAHDEQHQEITIAHVKNGYKIIRHNLSLKEPPMPLWD